MLCPCLALPSRKKPELIPVLRHYPKQYHQDVRLICTNEIEKDSCTAYKSKKVETVSKPKRVHGVAIVDSPPGPDYNYKRGDRLWLHMESKKPAELDNLTAPVVNLRTYETGTILIRHVCWYPRAKGPSGELWTFGGMVSLVGGQKTQSWIWAVIQSRDGKTTECDMVQLTPDCQIEPPERVALFKERLVRRGFHTISTLYINR